MTHKGKAYEFLLPPDLVEAIGGEARWLNLRIVYKKSGVARYYLNGVRRAKVNWGKMCGK